MEITIQAKSKNPDIVSLDSLPRGKLRDRLTSELGEQRSRKIVLEMPKEISEKYRKEYFEGLARYLQAAQGKYVHLDVLSSDEIFAMAVVAYSWNDVGPLQLRAKKIVVLLDKCYWLYLAEEPELFFDTVEVEMYRRRITRDLDVRSLSKNNELELKELNIDHVDIINNNGGRGKSLVLRDNSEQVIEQSPADNWDSVQLSAFDRSFISDILEDGFVLAGPFVDSCINRRYNLNSLDESFWRSLIDYFDADGNFKGLPDDNRRGHILSRHFGHFLDDKNPDDFIRYLLATFIKLKPPRWWSSNKAWKIAFTRAIGDYDLKTADPRFKELGVVNYGELFLRVMKLPEVVDVYSSSSELLETLVTKLKNSDLEVTVNFAVSALILNFKGSDFFYRFIKMEYDSFRDILASIDLDCDRVALRFNKEGAVEFAAPKSYINAVEYDICLANPCNDSSNYFHEVKSSRSRGYTIYVTPGMMSRAGDEDYFNESFLERHKSREPSQVITYQLRTVKETNNVYVPNGDGEFFQTTAVFGCQTVNSEVVNYTFSQLPRKFDILYPLVREFSESLWFRIRFRDPIQSIYVNYHRDNFLFKYISHFNVNSTEYGGQYYNPSYQRVDTQVFYGVSYNNNRSKQFAEKFPLNKLKDTQKQETDQNKLLRLLTEHLPTALAQYTTKFRQNDILTLNEMTRIAFRNVIDLERKKLLINKERERKIEAGEEPDEEKEDVSLILDDSIFEPRIEPSAGAAAEPAAVVQQEEEYNGGLDAE